MTDMETKANYVAVGAFVMACLIGLVVTLLWLAGVQYSQEYAYFQTNFKGPVTGLGDGTVVRYNGIEVGRITDLQFNPNDPQSVVVTLQVRPNLNIREDSEASIESQGLTGGSYVEISGGTAKSPFLAVKPGQKYPVIRTKASTLQQLEESAPLLVAKLNVAADHINTLLSDQNVRSFSGILTNLNETTGTLARRSGDIDSAIANISSASKTLQPTLADADDSVKKFGKLSADADAFVKGDGVTQLAELISQVRVLAASLTRLSDELDRQPTKLLFGDRRKGYTPK
jgi:phospholipid/cholesterol/gamma-HCH transport system substrate-binding protein